MPALSRRAFLQGLPPAGGLLPARAAGPRRRNLVFIIADQHSGMALGCAGRPIVRAPPRASLDTGLHVQTHGVRNNGIPLPNRKTAEELERL